MHHLAIGFKEILEKYKRPDIMIRINAQDDHGDCLVEIHYDEDRNLGLPARETYTVHFQRR